MHATAGVDDEEEEEKEEDGEEENERDVQLPANLTVTHGGNQR